MPQISKPDKDRVYILKTGILSKYIHFFHITSDEKNTLLKKLTEERNLTQ